MVIDQEIIAEQSFVADINLERKSWTENQLQVLCGNNDSFRFCLVF